MDLVLHDGLGALNSDGLGLEDLAGDLDNLVLHHGLRDLQNPAKVSLLSLLGTEPQGSAILGVIFSGVAESRFVMQADGGEAMRD